MSVTCRLEATETFDVIAHRTDHKNCSTNHVAEIVSHINVDRNRQKENFEFI